jgi:hypothetical protein
VGACISPIIGYIQYTTPKENKMQTKTIDLTPTWRGILPALLAIFEHGDRQTALDELAKMANLADRYNEMVSKVEYLPKREG